MTKAKPLIWCDPPAKRVVKSAIREEWAATIDLLSARPGEWAQLRMGMDKHKASSLQTSLGRVFRYCKFVTRKLGDGTYSLWGRTNG